MLRAIARAVVAVLTAATSAEVNAGTATDKAVTPDALAGSKLGIRHVIVTAFDGATDIATGDGKEYYDIPSALNGYDLVYVAASVTTAGTTGTTDIQLRNSTTGNDMLSTKLTIDSGEVSTETAATPAVINATYKSVSTGNRIYIDVDAASTTKPKGLKVVLGFQLP